MYSMPDNLVELTTRRFIADVRTEEGPMDEERLKKLRTGIVHCLVTPMPPQTDLRMHRLCRGSLLDETYDLDMMPGMPLNGQLPFPPTHGEFLILQAELSLHGLCMAQQPVVQYGSNGKSLQEPCPVVFMSRAEHVKYARKRHLERISKPVDSFYLPLPERQKPVLLPADPNDALDRLAAVLPPGVLPPGPHTRLQPALEPEWLNGGRGVRSRQQ
jgi:hypothetical protein